MRDGMRRHVVASGAIGCLERSSAKAASSLSDIRRTDIVTTDGAPYHAHIYFGAGDRAFAEDLHRKLSIAKGTGDVGRVVFVGDMRDRSVGPHPKPQFEVHFRVDALPRVLALIKASGLTALVHPLTDDDLADHTSLAQWIGEPLPLDHSVLDPPGMNQGIGRFGKSDF